MIEKKREENRMNETIKQMMERRSCRSFDPNRQIGDGQLQDLLTGRGLQNTVIVAVQDAGDCNTLRRLNAKYLGVESDPYYGAPTILVVLAKEDPDYHTPVEDGSLVMGNLMLAAHSLGLASIWIHRERQIFEDEEGKALLAKWGVTGNWTGIGACAVGYPSKELPAGAPRKEGRTKIIR